MVIGKLTSYLALGLVGAFLINALVRPASAIGTGAALTETGVGIGAIGTGIGTSIRSIGSSAPKLFDSLFTLKDLLYDANVSGAASVGPVSQQQGTVNAAQGTTNPSSSTITWSGGTTANVPSLSPAARSYYRGLGVSVN